MKSILTVLLFCLIIEGILNTKHSPEIKMAKVAKEKNDISTLKGKNLRKLNDTDREDSTNSIEINSTTIIDNQTENINAIAENLNVSSSKPVSVKIKTTKNKSAKVQFIKFFGFNSLTESGKATFGVYSYFLGRTIAKKIIMRLRINYLEYTNIAESARTVCIISDQSLAGTFASSDEGKCTKYNCEVNTTLGNANSANYILNSDVPLMIENANGNDEFLDFSELNFNGNSVSESNNIHANSLASGGYEITLTGTIASVDKYI